MNIFVSVVSQSCPSVSSNGNTVSETTATFMHIENMAPVKHITEISRINFINVSNHELAVGAF